MRAPRSILVAVPVTSLLFFTAAAPTAAVDTGVATAANLVTRLSGDQVVPGPGAVDTGTGEADIMIDSGAGTLCWKMWWDGIDEPTGAAIGQAAPGETGPTVLALTDPLDGGCLEGLDAATLEAFAADPSAYYLQLTTAAYPDGAIRGQLGDYPSVTYVTVWALLDGASVVPAAGDPAATGWVELNMEIESGSLCAYWAVTGLDDATAADIHAGMTGVVGDAVVSLPLPSTSSSPVGPPPPDASSPVEPPPPDASGEPTPAAEPCVSGLDPAVLQSIADDPGTFYVDAHTPTYPGGAVRGQLSFEPPPPPPCEAPMVCDGAIGPGDYAYYGFVRTLFFTLADEWQATNGPFGFSLSDGNGLLSFVGFSGFGAADACGTETIEVGTTPAEIAAWLSAHPALSGVGSGSTEVGGLAAISLDGQVTIPEACASTDLLLLPAFGSGGGTEPGSGDGGAVAPMAVMADAGYTVSDGDHLHLVLVDAYGGTVVIALSAPTQEALDALAAHAAGVLASVTWGPEPVPGETDGGTPGSESSGGRDVADTAMSSPGLNLAALVLLLAGLGLALRSVRRAAAQ